MVRNVEFVAATNDVMQNDGGHYVTLWFRGDADGPEIEIHERDVRSSARALQALSYSNPLDTHSKEPLMAARTWHRILHAVAVVSIVPGLAACELSRSGTSYDRAAAEAEIREMEQAWAHVAVSGNPAIAERIFADDFLGVSPEGVQYTKKMFIADTNANPLGFLSNDIDDIKVRFFGDVAIAQGSETFTRKGGEKGRFVWTDVLVRQDGAWRIAAAQDVIAPPSGQAAAGSTQAAAGSGPATTGPQAAAALVPSPSSGGPAPAPLFAGAGDANPSPEARAAIDAARTAYAAAWRESSAAKIADVYTADALVLYPGQAPVSGRQAIVEYFTGFFTEFPKNNFDLVSTEVVVNGAWAFDQGTYRWKGAPRSGGAAEEDHGKYLVVLQRQADGTWKVARDMDNSNRPASQCTRGSRS